MSAISSFFTRNGADTRGRIHAEILQLTDGQLEDMHDFIQWLFPLQERSRAVPNAPVLTPSDIEAIRQSPAAQASLLAALSRLQLFYDRNGHWLQPGDHNHLRITRIIASLTLLGQPEAAQAFYEAVIARTLQHPGSVSATTLAFWKGAVQPVGHR